MVQRNEEAPFSRLPQGSDRRSAPGDPPQWMRLVGEHDELPDRRYRAVEPSLVLSELPPALVESLRYLVNRFQLGDNIPFSSRLGVLSALHGEGVTTISRVLAAVIANGRLYDRAELARMLAQVAANFRK